MESIMEWNALSSVSLPHGADVDSAVLEVDIT